jgi:hypothetical protein
VFSPGSRPVCRVVSHDRFSGFCPKKVSNQNPACLEKVESKTCGRKRGAEQMTRTFRHIVIPALAPAAFFLIASTPVQVLGCFNRGLMALSVAMVSLIGGLIFTVKGGLGRQRGDPDALLVLA